MYQVDFKAPDKPPCTPFYKKKSFYWAIALWVILTIWLFPTNHDMVGDDIAQIIIISALSAISLFIMVMCAYATITSNRKIVCCVLGTILCFNIVLFNAGGAWISMTCIILVWSAGMQFIFYIALIVILSVIYVIKLVKGRRNKPV